MYKIIRENEFISTKWSGGTTNQLFIIPSNASISKQDFSIRISTATINTPTSEFTRFPLHNRFISILKGEIEFTTGNKPSKKVAETEFDFFDGADTTNSASNSKVIDFNIIYSKHLRLNIQQFTGRKNRMLNLITTIENFVFILKGSINFSQIEFHKNELLILEKNNQFIEMELSNDAVVFLFNFSNIETSN